MFAIIFTSACLRRLQGVSSSKVSLICLFLAFLASLLTAQNLLENGDFTAVENGTMPEGWEVPKTQASTLRCDQKDLPSDAPARLVVTVDGVGKGQGQVFQTVPVTPGSYYQVEGWIQAGRSEQGFIQVKLIKKRREGQRFSIRGSGEGWVYVSEVIEVGESDAIMVLLRYNQGSKNVGNSLAFANVSVTKTTEPVEIVVEAPVSSHASIQIPQSGDLVVNGDFSKGLEDGVPIGWNVPKTQAAKMSYVTSDAPAGASGQLSVTVEDAGSGQGQIWQTVPVQPGKIYFVEAWINSSRKAGGYLQIKLLKNGREGSRTSLRPSGEGWAKVSQEIDVQDSDGIMLLLRYNQGSGNVGDLVKFADVSFMLSSERVRLAPAISKVSGVPTFNSIGVYVDISGDMSRTTTAKAVYRKKGSDAWLPALEPVWHEKTGQFRMSLLNLQEDTEYEIAVGLSDATLETNFKTMQTSVRTWTSNVPIAKTIYLPAGESTAPLIIDESGTAEGWIRYTSDPNEPSILNAGMNGENAILIKDQHHVIIENITVLGGIKDAILITDSTDIRIQRCDISQWGQPGVLTEADNKKWGPGPFYMDEEGKRINLQGGVRVAKGAERIVIENSYIHNPRGRANSWGAGHPLGPTSIILFNPDGNLVIRNNDLIGGQDHRFNDTIEGAYNGYVTGGPHRDTDINGNVLFFSNDDGIELDGGQMNIRFFNNWIASSYCGVSTAPTIYGPSYIYRNLITLEGEERGETNFALKVGGDRSGGPGVNFFFHNTIWSNSKALRAGNWGGGPTPLVTRNNLFASGDVYYSQKTYGDFDYDMYREGCMDPALPEWQQNGVVGVERFNDRSAADYRLSGGSIAVDRGVPLATVNDGFEGAAPDLGAFPLGAPAEFPVRANSISLLPLKVNLDSQIGSSEVKTQTMTLVAPTSVGQSWRVLYDMPWLKVSPMTGPCDGRPHELTISIDPSNQREGLLEGAVTIRTDLGYNRSAFVRGVARIADPELVVFDVGDLKYEGFLFVPAKDGEMAYLQAPDTREDAADAFVQFEVMIDEPGVYYLQGLIQTPTPNAMAHDSLFVQVDEGEPTLWAFSRRAPSRWQWQVSSILKKEYPQAIWMDAGKHVITVRGRESLAMLAKLAFSRSTLSPDDYTDTVN
jgi:hypothetical protein